MNKPEGFLLSQERTNRTYIAGPMTGIPDFNFPAFNAVAAAMRIQGRHVENPAEHGLVEGAEWGDYLRYDLGKIASCETIALLPGWAASKGAVLEMHIAKTLGMNVEYLTGAEPDSPPVKVLGGVYLSETVRAVAKEIRHQNNRVNTPTKFQKHSMHEETYVRLKKDIAALLDVPHTQVDYVYFACANGAEEHVDQLDPERFTHRTVLLPVWLPKGATTLYANGGTTPLYEGLAYEINHELPHSLDVEDKNGGCVVIMASVLVSETA